MKYRQLIFPGLYLIITCLFCVAISSCSGQERRNPIINQSPQSSVSLTKKDNQISQVVRTVFQDSKGQFWFGGEGGAFKLVENELIHIEGIQDEGGRGVTIKDIAEDKEGKIWFAHTDGVSVVEKKSVTNYYESNGLLSNDAWCITIDKENTVWIGTIEGVCIFDGSSFSRFEIPEGKIDSTRGVSSTKIVHNIFEDSLGRIWFSTNGGVYIKEGASLRNLSEKDGLGTNFVHQVMEDKDGRFYLSTSKGLYKYDEENLENISNGISGNFKGAGAILQDSQGYIWYISNLRDIYRFKEGEEPSKYVISESENGPASFYIYEDQKKRMWFVGFGGAYRLENGKFINITKDGPW